MTSTDTSSTAATDTGTQDPAAKNPAIGKDVDANGIRTNYLESGSGDQTVVFVHGSGPGVTAYANWRLVLPALAARFRVLAPDMAGFGFSERPEKGEYGLDLWADQTLGFLDALDLGQVSLVGNSFGGAIALRIAANDSWKPGWMLARYRTSASSSGTRARSYAKTSMTLRMFSYDGW